MTVPWRALQGCTLCTVRRSRSRRRRGPSRAETLPWWFLGAEKMSFGSRSTGRSICRTPSWWPYWSVSDIEGKNSDHDGEWMDWCINEHLSIRGRNFATNAKSESENWFQSWNCRFHIQEDAGKEPGEPDFPSLWPPLAADIFTVYT